MLYKKIVITNTRWSPVKDILWISVEEPFMIKNIYKAAATVRNKDVRTIMYPPAEYFDRITKLESYCKDAREKDKDLRTQIRIGYGDIKLHLKKAGGFWKRYDPEMYGQLPEPDFNRVSGSPPKGREGNKRRREESASPKGRSKVFLMDEMADVNLDDTHFGDLDENEKDIIV